MGNMGIGYLETNKCYIIQMHELFFIYMCTYEVTGDKISKWGVWGIWGLQLLIHVILYMYIMVNMGNILPCKEH